MHGRRSGRGRASRRAADTELGRDRGRCAWPRLSRFEPSVRIRPLVHSGTRLGRRESRVRVPTRGGDLGSGSDTEPVAGVEVRRTDKARGGRGRGSRWHVSGRGSEGESEVFARSTIARDGGAHPTTKNLACSSPTGPGAACANLFSSSSLARVRRALGVAESRTALGRRTVGRSVRDVFDDVVSICAPTICPFPGLMPFFLAGSARSLALRTDGRRAASRRLPVGCMQPQASLALLAPCESGVRRREMEGGRARRFVFGKRAIMATRTTTAPAPFFGLHTRMQKQAADGEPQGAAGGRCAEALLDAYKAGVRERRKNNGLQCIRNERARAGAVRESAMAVGGPGAGGR